MSATPTPATWRCLTGGLPAISRTVLAAGSVATPMRQSKVGDPDQPPHKGDPADDKRPRLPAFGKCDACGDSKRPTRCSRQSPPHSHLLSVNEFRYSFRSSLLDAVRGRQGPLQTEVLDGARD
jgi:hypothetical protein